MLCHSYLYLFFHIYTYMHIYLVFIRKYGTVFKYVNNYGVKLGDETNLFSLLFWEYMEFVEWFQELQIKIKHNMREVWGLIKGIKD